MLGVIAQIDGFDPVAGQPVTIRAGSHDDAAVCHLTEQTWWPTLTKLPTLRYDLFDGAFSGQITSPTSSFSMSTEPWPNFARYSLPDARLQIWTGEIGTAFGAWTLRFDGRISAQPQIADGVAQFSAAVDDRWLDSALLATYAGTTGLEGPADLKGQTKPLALGAPRYVPGKLIDSVNNVWQISAYGAIVLVEAALERLARFGPSIGDYATYEALVAASIPAGRWGTCLAQGLARFGAPTTGQISFLVRGDTAGPNGWARLPGQIVRRLALISGGAGKIDDTSLNVLDVIRPYNLSLYIDAQTTARELIQKIAASINAVAGVTWTGKLFVAPIRLGDPAFTLAADGSSPLQVSKVEQIEISAPWQKLTLAAQRTWAVHALADIAFTSTLLDLGAYAGDKTYRDGNIVQNQNTSWLYINPTPSAGNPPPTLPTAQNAYWKALARSDTASFSQIADDNGALGALLSQAAQAASDAQEALDQLTTIASDGVLARDEKKVVILNWQNIVAEASRLDAQADGLAVSRADYDLKRGQLGDYLNSLSPAWNDTSHDTAIVRATWNGWWTAYYAARTSLINAMVQKTAEPTSVVNLVKISLFEKGATGECGWLSPSTDGSGIFAARSAFNYLGKQIYQVVSNPTAAEQVVGLISRTSNTKWRFSVTPGKRLMFAALFQALGGRIAAYLRFFNAAGEALPTLISFSVASGLGYPTQTPLEFPFSNNRRGTFGVVPADAARAEMEFYQISDGAQQMQFCVAEPMVAEVSNAATTFPMFVPGPNSDDGADITGQNTALDTAKLAGRSAAEITGLVDETSSIAHDAKSIADAVQGFTNNVVDGNKVTGDEKKRYQGQIPALGVEVNRQASRAYSVGINAETDAYVNSWNTFYNYLVNTVQVNNTSVTTSIDRNYFVNLNNAFMAATQALQDALKARAQTIQQDTGANLFLDPRFKNLNDKTAWSGYDSRVFPEDSSDGRRVRFPPDLGSDAAIASMVFVLGPNDRIDVEFEFYVNGGTAAANGEGGNFGVWAVGINGSNQGFGLQAVTRDVGSSPKDGWYKATGSIRVAASGRGDIASGYLYIQTQPITGGNAYIRNPQAFLVRGSNSNLDSNGRQSSAQLTTAFLAGAGAQIQGLQVTWNSAGFISITSFSVDFGDGFVGISGGTISGLAVGPRYYVWLLAPNLNDSGRSFSVNTDYQGSTDKQRVYLGYVQDPGSGGGGGGFNCVEVSSFLDVGKAAGWVQPGDLIELLSDDWSGTERAPLESSENVEADCVELETKMGAKLICSACTPIERRDGTTVRADASAGQQVASIIDGRFIPHDWIRSVTPRGKRQVARIHVGGRVFAAGTEARARIFTHNWDKP